MAPMRQSETGEHLPGDATLAAPVLNRLCQLAGQLEEMQIRPFL